jgi:hypothetical protein
MNRSLEVRSGLVEQLWYHFTNDDAASEDLSEEDQQLKSELDMLVERLTVCMVVVCLLKGPC